MARHLALQVVLALALAIPSWAGTGAFGFTVFNQSCAQITARWDAFADFGGNTWHVGAGNVTVKAGESKNVLVGFSFPDYDMWSGGYGEVVTGGIETGADIWKVGQPCQPGGSVAPTNAPGTNVSIHTVYMPVFARVHVPGGPDTNALVRIYKKTVLTTP